MLLQLGSFLTCSCICLFGHSTLGASALPPSYMEKATHKTDHWIEVGNQGKAYTFDLGVKRISLPVTLAVENHSATQASLKPGGSLIGKIKGKAEEYAVAEFDTGSGVANPLVCIYRIGSDAARLVYVWSKPVPSVYRFTSAKLNKKQLTIRADYPSRVDFPREYHSKVELPIPEDLVKGG